MRVGVCVCVRVCEFDPLTTPPRSLGGSEQGSKVNWPEEGGAGPLHGSTDTRGQPAAPAREL